MRVSVFHEDLRGVVLEDLTVRKNKYLVALDNRVQSVRDRDHCAFLELMLDQLLDALLRDDVDVRGGFVKDHDSVLAQNGPADANHLLLTCAEVRTAFADLEVNAFVLFLPLLALTA